MRRIFQTIIFLSLCVVGPARAEDPVKVATTLPAFAKLAQEIGGEAVEVHSIVKPGFDPHFIEPKPSDVLRVKKADLFVHSGTDLEGWSAPLLVAAGRGDMKPGGTGHVAMSAGITLLEVPEGQPSRSMGDLHLSGNPHFWHNPENMIRMAGTLKEALARTRPAQASLFETNAGLLVSRLERSIVQWKQEYEPFKGRQVMGYHNEWLYMVEFLGLEMKYYLEDRPGIPPTPKHLERLSAVLPQSGIRILLHASFSPRDMVERFAEANKLKAVELSQSPGEAEPDEGILRFFENNFRKLLNELRND